MRHNRIMRRARGFTLVELIMVMVISSIVGAAVVLLIRRPVEAYVESAERAELADTADAAIRMMVRDLRIAVPNSVRVIPNGAVPLLEMIPSVGAGRYYTPSNVQAGEVALDFTAAGAVTFSAVLAAPPAPIPPALAPNRFIIVGNSGAGFPDADAYLTAAVAPGRNGNRAVITAINGAQVTFNDPANPAVPVNVFARGGQAIASPSDRFFVAEGPLTYRCDTVNRRLERITGYAFTPVQADPSPVAPVDPAVGFPRVASHVVSCKFSLVNTPTRNNSLVSIEIVLQRPGANQPSVTLSRQVQLDNRP